MDTEDDMEDMEGEESADGANSSTVEYRRNQTTAVILFGVIGALFDLEVTSGSKLDLQTAESAVITSSVTDNEVYFLMHFVKVLSKG